eukprot:351140-Chlamydomonas_euryale.AAC.41
MLHAANIFQLLPLHNRLTDPARSVRVRAIELVSGVLRHSTQSNATEFLSKCWPELCHLLSLPDCEGVIVNSFCSNVAACIPPPQLQGFVIDHLIMQRAPDSLECMALSSSLLGAMPKQHNPCRILEAWRQRLGSHLSLSHLNALVQLALCLDADLAHGMCKNAFVRLYDVQLTSLSPETSINPALEPELEDVLRELQILFCVYNRPNQQQPVSSDAMCELRIICDLLTRLCYGPPVLARSKLLKACIEMGICVLAKCHHHTPSGVLVAMVWKFLEENRHALLTGKGCVK